MNVLTMLATNPMILAVTTPAPDPTTSDPSLGSFFGALTSSVQTYVRIIIMLIGIVMVGFGVYQIAKNLISHGKAQTNWFVTIALIVLGGIFMLAGGFSVLKTFTKSTEKTVKDLSEGKADDGQKPSALDGGLD